MARFEDFWHIINPWEFLDSNIKEMADYVNNKLIEFNDSKFYNHWFVLDFPSYDVIRKIYNGNDLNRSYRSIATNLKLSGVSMDMDDLNLDLSLQDSKVPEYNRDLNIYYDSYYYFSKSEITQLNGRNITTNNCIQRKFQKTKSNNNNNNSKMQKKNMSLKRISNVLKIQEINGTSNQTMIMSKLFPPWMINAYSLKIIHYKPENVIPIVFMKILLLKIKLSVQERMKIIV